VKTFAKRLREKQKADEQRHVEAAGRARAVKLQKIAEQRAQAAEAEKAGQEKAEKGNESGEAVGSTTHRRQAPVSQATTESQSPCVTPRRDVERMPEPKTVGDKGQSKVSEALAVFSDDELIEELDRRGWYGVMRKVMVVELTKD
jgi:hypothetical protein